MRRRGTQRRLGLADYLPQSTNVLTYYLSVIFAASGAPVVGKRRQVKEHFNEAMIQISVPIEQ